MGFPPTHLTVFERIRSADAEVRRAAFGDLTEGYWKPSYRYIRLHWRLDAETAADLVQGFFATAFEKHYVERFDPGKARFRTFLRTCLDRYTQNHFKAEQAAKRGGQVKRLSLDFPGAEREIAAATATDLRDLDRFFHDETVRALFAASVDVLKREYHAGGKDIVFDVFDRHDLQPGPDTSYATVAREMNLTTSQVTNHLHAARGRFREIVLARLRTMVGSDEEFRAEARELFGLDVPE